MQSAYERFIAANEALTKCWDGVSVKDYLAMDSKTQAATCCNEQKAVADMLKADQVHFRSLIDARISALKAQTQ